MAMLSDLAERRHVPATFAYADALFNRDPEDAIVYLREKSVQGLLGAAFRSVLMKVFFAQQPLVAEDVRWIAKEAERGHQEAMIVMLHLSEGTRWYNVFADLLWQQMPDAAEQLCLAPPTGEGGHNTLHQATLDEAYAALAEQFMGKQNENVVRCCMRAANIRVYENVLGEVMRRHLMLKFDHRMRPSHVIDPVTGKAASSVVRTSTYFQITQSEHDWMTLALERKLSMLSQTPLSHGEPLSLLRYAKGQEYKPHYDAFVGDDTAIKQMLDDGGQRVRTLICYLQHADKGGETVFPKLGVSLLPAEGSVLMFDNLRQDGEIDTDAYHAGMPVEMGCKWVVTKWVRSGPTLYGRTLYAPLNQ